MTAGRFPLAPGSTIGILGGGQLGRMLAMAAAELGLAVHIYAPEADSPAFDVARAHTVAAWDDEVALAGFARAVDVVTFEFENIPAAAAHFLAERTPVLPPPRALETGQDRLAEKNLMVRLGIAVPPYAAVTSAADIEVALSRIGRPAMLKTRRLGYDGKGQTTIRHGDDPAAAFAAVGRVPALLEAFVPFDMEVSAIVARGRDGAVRAYDIGENRHIAGTLATTRVPAALDPAVAASAVAIAEAVAAALDYVGVLAVEMFVVGVGPQARLLVNEIAPRVHNSGHWTSDGCLVSQFEQHIRAIAGWPLGEPVRHSDTVMENLIGDAAGNWATVAAEPGACLHLYGKREARPGRKMGHVNRLAPRPSQR